MSTIGQLLEPTADESYNNVYSSFTEYFNNPNMTKIKDVNNHSMYIAKVNTLLGIEFRYIIAFVYKDGYPLGSKEELKNLPWISLQTRTLTDEYKLPLHNYIPRRLQSLNKEITLIRNDDKHYIYNVSQLPLEIVLLTKQKRGQTHNEYNQTGNIISALETYQTIISLKNGYNNRK